MRELKSLWYVLGLLLSLLRPALGDEARHEINFPNVPGYVTVKCDLHTHTVFSDGQVWPTVRVAEAWRQGLDCIAITDHIEYQPHHKDVPTSHNRPYDLAREPAAVHDLLFPRGTEITRDTPPGHFNAVFTTDNDELDTKDLLEAVKRASEQGAFVFWNHQGWKGPAKGRWLDVHTAMYDNKWLHGMEVCNGNEYYPDAHRWCLEKNLTMLGNSDIHDPDLRKQSLPEDHRTMTLVFAKARTLSAVKEALLEGRTAVWFKDQVIGRQEYLDPLFAACIQVGSPVWRQKSVSVQVQNNCDTDIHLKRSGGAGPSQLPLPARTTSLVHITIGHATESVQLTYTVTNFLIGPETGLPVVLAVPKPQ
jgi:3',5'-nucleoside bisphosphate phosphatase